MKRLAWLLAALILLGSALTAHAIYPSQKWWMRAGYVKGFHVLNWITGQDLPPPDRFQ